MNILAIPLVMTIVFLIASLVFGLWAFSSRQDYKNNVDQKISAAVDLAKKETASSKDTEFIDREKQPLKDYKGPSTYGSIQVKYPKTWSAFVDDSGRGAAPVDGFFHPSYVPSSQTGANFALRLQVVNSPFATELRNYDTQVRTGKATSQPYKPVNVANVLGIRIDGEIVTQKQGSVVLLPLRDKTIKIWTEADQYKKDFDENILPNFTFTP